MWTNGAFAMETHTFDFAKGQINAEWQALGPIKIEQVPDGLLLTTGDATGAILTDSQLPWTAQAGRLTSAGPAEAEVKFVWAYPAEADPKTYSVSADVPLDRLAVTSFDLTHVGSWHGGEKRIGIALPPHTVVLVSKLEFARWNPLEQLAETSASFWWMDQYRPYSINFLWGPQLASNPVARQHAYIDQPPVTLSTTFVLMAGLLALTLLAGGWYAMSGRTAAKRRTALLVTGAAFAACWLLLDVRMGMEFLTWVEHDRTSFMTASPPARTFRDRDNFYDFAAFAAPLVSDRNTYLFFAEREWPYLGNLRYLTYPAIPGNAFDTDDTWVVYRRPDLTVNAEGRLALNGTAISGSGKVIGKFDDGSFVFRVSTPAPAKP